MEITARKMRLLRIASIVSSLVASATATPALVWKHRSLEDTHGSNVVHTSKELSASELLATTLEKDTSLSVVFLLGRDSDGTESLTNVASELTQVAAKPANVVHHCVTGVRSGVKLVQDASKLPGKMPLLVNLDELASKLKNENVTVEIDANGSILSKSVTKMTKRAKALNDANVLIVNVEAGSSPQELDSYVVEAMGKADTVILSAVRSVDEVKQERFMNEQRRLAIMHKAGRKLQDSRRRRLEENADGNDQSSDLSGVYYVTLTPNIFAGILFFFLFATVTWIGISCMGMIAGQDVYVNKLPAIGREA